MKLCVYNTDATLKEKVTVIRVERNPKNMKKGWCILHLEHGYIVAMHYKDIRKWEIKRQRSSGKKDYEQQTNKAAYEYEKRQYEKEEARREEIRKELERDYFGVREDDK